MQTRDAAREVVVITGGSAGLGRAIANRFAAAGASVGIIARGRERLEHARRELETSGVPSLAFEGDVADAETIEQFANAVEQQLGPIDVWVNNAMLSVYSPVKEMQAEEYRRVTEVTYLSYVYGTLAALRRMLPRNRGVIIQVGSTLAHRSIPIQSAYCAAKHAIMGFHESLLSELIHDRSSVRTTMVQMPALNTPQFDWAKSRLPNLPQPVPPIYQPEVGAEAVFFAARHDVGRELFVSWRTVLAIHANKFIPGFIDRKLARDAYRDQQSDTPEPAFRTDNLWAPAPGEWAAHGRFDRNARDHSAELRFVQRTTLFREWVGRLIHRRSSDL